MITGRISRGNAGGFCGALFPDFTRSGLKRKFGWHASPGNSVSRGASWRRMGPVDLCLNFWKENNACANSLLWQPF